MSEANVNRSCHQQLRQQARDYLMHNWPRTDAELENMLIVRKALEQLDALDAEDADD